MPAKEISPEEFEEISKHILTTEHKKGIGDLTTNLSEEEISRDIKKIFDGIYNQGYEFVHTLEVIPDDGSKPYFIHRDNVDRT